MLRPRPRTLPQEPRRPGLRSGPIAEPAKGQAPEADHAANEAGAPRRRVICAGLFGARLNEPSAARRWQYRFAGATQGV